MCISDSCMNCTVQIYDLTGRFFGGTGHFESLLTSVAEPCIYIHNNACKCMLTSYCMCTHCCRFKVYSKAVY